MCPLIPKGQRGEWVRAVSFSLSGESLCPITRNTKKMILRILVISNLADISMAKS